MIQVRDVLQVKFGKIDQAVALFTRRSMPEVAEGAAPSPVFFPGEHFEVLTDITGTMYTLVNEFVVDSLAQFEALNTRLFSQPWFGEWFEQFQLFVEGGRREFYNVEGGLQSWSRPGVVVVREAYQAYKWQIRQAVALLQRYGGLLVDRGVGLNPRILTDAGGPMFQAIIEIETESMSAWESHRRSLFQQVEFQVWFNQMLNSVEAGSHEFYRVEFTGK